MSRLIGLAGHVDHGKTSLILALTGIDADRLPEEKRRGMTIDLGFAYVDLPNAGRTSIVDVPGHERFLTNMLVGALGMDLALVCVSATEGVMPQTREHVAILDVLPVQRVVVALTQCDLADADSRELARLDVSEFFASTRFGEPTIIETSAKTGEGIDALRAALDAAAIASEKSADGPWYLPIDRSFSVKGHGVVVTGTLAQGIVRVGDEALLQPGDLRARVRSIHSHDVPTESSSAGNRTALNLSGVRAEDVERGMMIGAVGAVFSTQMVDASVRWTGQVKHAERIRAAIGADDVVGKAFLNDADPSLVQLRFERPIACAAGQSIVIRKHSPPTLLGGGKIVTPQARLRKRSESVTVVDATDVPTAIMELLYGQSNGVSTDEVARRLGATAQRLGDDFERLLKEGRALGFAGLWYAPAEFERATERFLAELRKLHVDKPRQAAHPREAVVAAARLGWTGRPLDRIIQRLESDGAIVAQGGQVRAADFALELNPNQSKLLDRVCEELERELVNVPAALVVANALKVPVQAVEEILRLGVEAGRLVRVEDGLFYTETQLNRLKDEMIAKFGSQTFTAAEFRDAFQSSRRYVVAALEYFDAKGVTVRVGDRRGIRNGGDR